MPHLHCALCIVHCAFRKLPPEAPLGMRTIVSGLHVDGDCPWSRPRHVRRACIWSGKIPAKRLVQSSEYARHGSYRWC